jgi:putative resolvase
MMGWAADSGSGLNGKSPKMTRILSDPSASVIVVEYRDRMARFGVEHLDDALAAQSGRILVVDNGENTDDLLHDMIEVLTCVRLYGPGERNRESRAVSVAKQTAPDARAG